MENRTGREGAQGWEQVGGWGRGSWCGIVSWATEGLADQAKGLGPDPVILHSPTFSHPSNHGQ